MAAPAVTEYLLRKSKETEDIELGQRWAYLDELHAKKLWHQLTEELTSFVCHPVFQNGGLVELYHNFITDFEHKVNPLALAELTLIIVKEIQDFEQALVFIENVKEKVKTNVEAKVLCMIVIGSIKLGLNRLDELKSLLEEAGKELDTLDGVTSVHARYYDLHGEYSKIKGDHAGYYRNALKYLGCVDLKKMTIEEKSTRAFCIAIAALVGEGVYNFGELLGQGVLEGLKYTDKVWLIDLLQSFNEGDLMRFEKLRPHWEHQPDLLSNQEKLAAKIRLLCLMELVFRRHAHERTIDFQTIAQAAHVDVAEVEILVMRALSLGLVKGTIDEIDKQVNMTWVQPRVLDYKQVENIKERVSEWVTQVKYTQQLMEDSAPEIMT